MNIFNRFKKHFKNFGNYNGLVLQFLDAVMNLAPIVEEPIYYR